MIVRMRDLLKHAETHNYAVGYFESFNMDCMLAVVHAAEKCYSPVIIGFGGQFLSSPKRKYSENIYNYGAAAREIARNSSVPVAVLLNEADQEAMAYQGLQAGFNTVMYVKPGESYEDRTRITKELCRAAGFLDIDVEGEFDELPCQDAVSGTHTEGANTDIEKAKHFVSETGISALSVAIGNVHLLEKGHSALDFDLLDKLHQEIPVPLVLHGGTGVAEDEMKKAIRMGIAKINVGTVIKRTYLNAVTEFIQNHNIINTDVHVTIGWGGDDDIISYGQEKITNLICRYMDIFGSKGMAEAFPGSCKEKLWLK